MTQRCLKALARTLVVCVAVATTAVGALHAQATGKIEGYIRDAQKQPIANATVSIVGTSFHAPSNAQGYYFIENVPAGSVEIRAEYIGYKPQQVQGLRVTSGQTITQDFTLEQQAATISDIVTTVQAQNALVPRDQVTTKQTVTGDMVHKLPVDRLLQALALQPGVVQVNTCSSNPPCVPLISVRGGRVDQNATYIDGVPVQNGIHTGQARVTGGTFGGGGAPQLTVAVNGFEDASITTGASSASQGNAQGGIINISTKTGGNKFIGNLGYETGLLGLATYGQGLNIFSGSVSGPIGKHLTFFASGRVEGQNSTNGGNHSYLFPSYARVSIDTTYTIAAGGKASSTANAAVDSVKVPVYNIADVEGACNNNVGAGVTPFSSSTFAPIAGNYGQKCSANQAYTSPTTNYFTTDKLNFSFGQGSRLALSYLYSGNQNRATLQDGTTQGSISGSNVATLNWTQTLIRQATHQLTLDASVSRQWNNAITSELTAASEAATRSSPLGFITKKLQFEYTA